MSINICKAPFIHSLNNRKRAISMKLRDVAARFFLLCSILIKICKINYNFCFREWAEIIRSRRQVKKFEYKFSAGKNCAARSATILDIAHRAIDIFA